MPLIGILAGMEEFGFKIDQTVLAQLNEEMTQKAADIEKSIYIMAGSTFNINSPKQLGDVLFKKLALPTGRKTQNGFSTDSDVLDMLYDKHPVIKEIIEYRQLTKLRSTFVEGLSKNIDPSDQRVHTTFNQTLTTTGRLSSSEPNLQNIPIKQEVGREIRKAFVATAGNILIDADYSQIELRLLAELSKDEEMLEAFRQNDDIHMNTAEEIFDMPRSMITKSMRSAAKTVNFSIVYGISDFGLARDLGVTLKEAHSYISEYYKKYPGVKIYLEGLVKEAYSRGYVETLFHRRRNIHELKSANRNIRMFGERVAMNTPVQGTAADIIKIAMVLVSKKLDEAGYKTRLVLQVHDELILEAPEVEAEAAASILKESMEEAVKLSIPFIAEVKTGRDWYQAK
jgi:DNA polymerase-1